MKRVLIIDDENDITHNLKNILVRNLACEVQTATSFRGALDSLKEYAPDLVFLDINLGDGNGYDLLPVIKNNKAIRVVMMSAYEKDYERIRQSGAHIFMQKPFTKEHVLDALEHVGAT